MKIRFNVAEIMRRAHDDMRWAKKLGSRPELPFAYYLKGVWRGARADKIHLLDGMNAGGHGLCFVMDD